MLFFFFFGPFWVVSRAPRTHAHPTHSGVTSFIPPGEYQSGPQDVEQVQLGRGENKKEKKNMQQQGFAGRHRPNY
jgi:hypothetical protein